MTTQTRERAAVAPVITPESAAEALTQIVDVGRKLAAESLAAVEALRKLEAEAGQQLLDATLAGKAGAGGRVHSDMIGLRTQIDLLRRQETAAREEHGRRILALKQAQAAAMRARGAVLIKQADAHFERTTELLEQLREHEGAEYAPVVTTTPNPLDPSRLLTLRPLTRSQALRNEGEAVTTSADAKARELASTSGEATAVAVDALLAAMFDSELVIPPLSADVIAWAARGEDAERSRRAEVLRRHPELEAERRELEARRAQAERAVFDDLPEFIPVDAPISLHMVWRNGRIDEDQSIPHTRRSARASAQEE